MKIWLNLLFVASLTSCAYLEGKSKNRQKVSTTQYIYKKTIEHKFSTPLSTIWNFKFTAFGSIHFSDTPDAPIICKGYTKDRFEPLWERQVVKGSLYDLNAEIAKIKCFTPKPQNLKYTLLIKDIPLPENEFSTETYTKLINLRKKYRGLYKDLDQKRYSKELNVFLKENRFFHEQTFSVKPKDELKPLAVIHRDEQIYIKHVSGEVSRSHLNVRSFGPKGASFKNPPGKLLAPTYPYYSLICGSITSDSKFDEVIFYGQGPFQYKSKNNLSIFCGINHRTDKEEFLTGQFEFVYQIIPEDVQTIIVATLARLESEIVPLEQKREVILKQKLSTLP